MDAAPTWTKPAFEAAASGDEGIPRGFGVDVFGPMRGGVGWLQRQDDADGPSPVGEDVGGAGIPHLTHDPRGMRLQIANADNPFRRTRMSGLI